MQKPMSPEYEPASEPGTCARHLFEPLPSEEDTPQEFVLESQRQN